jgi:nitroimidazol reductase NimA-like FMN-containing flavoprotein (pyridoxamine 5'-phosphate oxidase superfamily)
MRLIDPRTGIEVMDRDECLRLLEAEVVGRLAVVEDGRPVILPVNYAMDGERIVFRTADGTKLDAVVRGGAAAFEIDHTDRIYQTGWSVLVSGRAEVITDDRELERARALPLRPWSSHEKSNWVAIHPQTITGRRIVAVAPPDSFRG